MSWHGYFTLDGAEFANSARFEAYAAAAPWFRPVYHRADLAWALETEYTDPATDLAPWYDPDVPVSADFWGFYPTAVDGLEGSSRSSSPVESTVDGGVPGRTRHASKTFVFAGFLAGGSDEAVAYGMNWLRRTLLGGLCSPSDARKQALGADLVFLGYEPHSSDDIAPEAVYDAAARRFRRVAVTNGPAQTAARSLSCGDHMAMVTFTATAGDPFEYGTEKRILTDYVPEMVDSPWGPDITAGTHSDLYVYAEDPCARPMFTPIYDPLCASVIIPPTPPNVSFGCWVPPEEDDEWDRALVTIPEQNFPTWTEMLPLITIATSDEIRDLRIRFYRDPDENLEPEADPCSWLSDIVISYIPPGSLMEIDSSFRDVHVTTSGGHRRRADSLIFSTQMRPVEWPVLECGVQHLMTVDSRTGDFPEINLALIPRAV